MSDDFTASASLTTGLILAGGAGRRVGNRDKGLLEWRGDSLVARVCGRLEKQVDSIVISCNRNSDKYRQFAPVVVSDKRGGYQGPLAGLEAALANIHTEFLAVVPCDTPLLPLDLVHRLLSPLQEDDTLAVSYAHADGRDHYLCAVVRSNCLPSLSAYLDAGERSVRHWYAGLHSRAVCFDPAGDAFLNLNQL